jgi:hypothetical protein
MATATTSPFTPVLATTPPDPTKHVAYTLGMVLGKDDFDQEFAYLSARDHWVARDLLGYGTVRGLRVHVELDQTGAGNGPEVIVDAGIALTPDGHVVRVRQNQCAYLNAWLSAPPAGVTLPTPAAVTGLTGTYVTLYVMLSYAATLTDMVPIPGEPCRSEDDASAPSRVADDFLIELGTAPPSQVEEDAMQDLFTWLGAVQVVSTGGLLLADFLTALRNAVAPTATSATPPPPYMVSSAVQVSAANVPSFWRAALRVYVTELRANDLARTTTPAPASWIDAGVHGDTASGDAPVEKRLLLAKLIVPVPATGPLSVVVPATGTGVTVDETTRPYLVSGELLKTAVLAAGQQSSGAAQAATAAAQAAQATATAAVTTANAASAAAAGAVTTANAASTAAAGAVTTANTAGTTATTASALAQRAVLLETSGYGCALVAAGNVVPLLAAPATVAPMGPGVFYGTLVAEALAAGIVTVTFAGVSPVPAGGVQYVVKALVQPIGTSTVIDPIVTLKAFPPTTVTLGGVANLQQLTLRVRDGAGDVSTANLNTVSLMLEISAFFKNS